MNTQPDRRRYTIVLAAIAAGILVAGAAIKPEPKHEPVISESERLRLQQLSDRRELERLAAQFSTRAEAAAEFVVADHRLPSGALVWKNGKVIMPHPQAALIAADGATAGRAPALRPTPITPGEWLLAVTRTPENGEVRFRRGIYSGSFTSNCVGLRVLDVQIPLDEAFLSAGVFDLDGYLVGIAVECGGALQVLAAGEIEKVLARNATLEGRISVHYGMRTAASEFGLIITELNTEGSGAESGLHAGDAIIAVDGQPPSLELLLSTSSPELTVLRGRRKLAIKFGEGGVRISAAPLLPLVEDLDPGSNAAKAGLMEGDRIVLINGVAPSSAAEAARAIERRPSLVVVQRNGKEVALMVAE
jgi:PDZ domain